MDIQQRNTAILSAIGATGIDLTKAERYYPWVDDCEADCMVGHRLPIQTLNGTCWWWIQSRNCHCDGGWDGEPSSAVYEVVGPPDVILSSTASIHSSIEDGVREALMV